MAEEEDQKSDDGEEEPSEGGGKKKLIIIIAIVLLLIIGGVAGAYFMGLLDPLLGGEEPTEEIDAIRITGSLLLANLWWIVCCRC